MVPSLESTIVMYLQIVVNHDLYGELLHTSTLLRGHEKEDITACAPRPFHMYSPRHVIGHAGEDPAEYFWAFWFVVHRQYSARFNFCELLMYVGVE